MNDVSLITKPHSISWKFLCVLIPIMALAALLFLVLYALQIQAKMERELHDKVQLISQMHSMAVAEPLWTLNIDALERSVQTIAIHPEIVCAEVREPGSQPEYLWPSNCIASAANEALHSSPLEFHGQNVGQLNLYYTDSHQIAGLKREVLIGALFFFLLATVAGIGAFAALRLIVGVPLSRLMQSIRAKEKDEKQHLVDWSSQDELGSVIDAYNAMIKSSDAHTQELVVARKEAELAADSKSRFLASMSHELRTPLNAVIGITEMMREDAEDLDQDTEPHRRVTAAGKHLLGLIDNILDFSKIEVDKIVLATEPIDLNELLTEIVETTRPLAEVRNNKLILEAQDIAENIQSDPTRLRQIILNLVGNACKFTESGSILVSAKQLDESSESAIRIEVSDTGIGIPPQEIETLFDAFTQADDSTTRKYGGTGLGLAISQRLCQLMGTTLSVESQVGKGSTFGFDIKV